MAVMKELVKVDAILLKKNWSYASLEKGKPDLQTFMYYVRYAMR
jgi:hypothetical protein